MQESIDFGLLPSNGPPATIKLLLLNSGNKPIPVQNVIATPVTEAMQIDFSPTKIPPDTVKPSVVAQVKFDRKLQQFFLLNIKCFQRLPRRSYYCLCRSIGSRTLGRRKDSCLNIHDLAIVFRPHSVQYNAVPIAQ